MFTTTSKTIFLLSLLVGLATSRINERQRQTLVEESSSSSSSSSIECVINLQADNEDEYEDTMCQRRRLQEGVLTDEYIYVELPEMLELLYEDEIEQGSLVISINGGEIEHDQVVWDHISDLKVLEPSNVIICQVGIQDDNKYEDEEENDQQLQKYNNHETVCILFENGMETSQVYRMTLPESMMTQFEQDIQDGTLFVSMIGATIDGNRLIVPENESNIKALVLEEAEEE